MLAGFYAVFVGIIAIVKPQWVPALPPEARIFREPDGKNGTSGIQSLTVLVVIAALVGVLCAQWLGQKPLDERIVLSTSAGVSVAFVIALANRALKLGWVSAMAEKVTFVLVPPLALIFLVLGTIFLGVATPTEGGAMGAAGALLMAWARRRLSMQSLKEALDGTAKLTTFVVFILIGARVFSLTFYGVNGHVWVEELLTALPGGQTGFLIAVNVLIFFLAFFLDFFELAFIIVPLLGPVADKLGIDLVWFGVLLAVNMQTSFMHPPFGFALFYLRSVAPASAFLDRVTGKLTAPVTTGQIYWGAVPFVIMQLMMVGVLIAFPGLVLVYRDVPDKPAARPELRMPLQQLRPQDAEEEDLTAAFGGVSDRAPIAKIPAKSTAAETARGEAEAAEITQSLTTKPR
jgi:TRAP-type mannitol/chloroaromatic compound transport system permease large subunit